MIIEELEVKISSLKKRITDISIDSITQESFAPTRNQFIGSKSELSSFYNDISALEPNQRPLAGKSINDCKLYIESFFERLQSQILEREILKENESDIDVTAPFHENSKEIEQLPSGAALHPITEDLQRILTIYEKMGFQVFEAREIDTEYYIFDSLGFPKNHPARENWDAFKTEEGLTPIPHTSNMQVRIMKYFKEPPIRAVMYGRCFRNEAVDVVHGHTFHQIEGIYIDKGITISHMIATIKSFIESFFEQEIVWKIQPAYFPFVEPGIEFMIRCVFCDGKGCSSCKNGGWLEMAGAGMIHPVVLREGGIDPQMYSGFAWGLGLDRMVIQKNKIKDIRSLFGSDVRFLQKK